MSTETTTQAPADFRQEDYLICFNWKIVFDYTQVPRRGSGRKSNRAHTNTTTTQLGLDRNYAELGLQTLVKQRRYWKLDRIHSITPVSVCWAFHRTTQESLPREQYHLIQLPETPKQ